MCIEAKCFTLLNNKIRKYNAKDLLSKVSACSFFIKTTIFKDKSEGITSFDLNYSLYYLFSLFITRGLNENGKIISGNELKELVHDIGLTSNNLTSTTINDKTNRILFAQNNKTEKIGYFRYFDLLTLPSYQKKILSKFEVDIVVFQKLVDVCNKMYHLKGDFHNVNMIEFIDDFEKYNNCNFNIDGELRLLLEKFSANNGQYLELYNPNYSNYSIDKSRTCCVNIKGEILCFIPELIYNRLLKFFPEKFLDDNKMKEEWFTNRAKWSEENIASLFTKYLYDSEVNISNYYGRKGNRHENDLIINYKGYLIIIEVKSTNVTPDFILDDEENVIRSYEKNIEKAITQTNKVETFIQNEEISIFYDNLGKEKIKFEAKKVKEIIKMVVVYEEMPSFLPSYQYLNTVDNGTIVINFYDLFMVFDYLDNPLLILRYLQERTKKVNIHINVLDEMTYLLYFTSVCFNYIDIINDSIGFNDNYDIYLEPSENEIIELYYMNPGAKKPDFKINSFLKKILSKKMYNLSSLEVDIINLLMNISEQIILNIEKNIELPTLYHIGLSRKEKDYVLIVKKDRLTSLLTCGIYFNKHPDVKEIVVMYFDKNRAKVKCIKKNNQEMKKILNNYNVQ